MAHKLYINDRYIPYINNQKRIQLFYGGSSSGKSYFISQRTIIDVLNGRNYLILRNVASTLRNSVYNQIVKTIVDMGLKTEFQITKSEMAITCLKNRKQILFAGLDDVEKLKSVTPIDGVLTDIWIEEATETKYEDYKQLTKRLRGIDKEKFTKRIIFTFNPILKTHWIYKEFFGNWQDDKNLYEDDTMLIVKSTYKDNHFLSDDDIYSLENETDSYFYEVYTLGNWGILGAVIFKNWHTEDLSNRIKEFDHIFNGLDFGYAQDPNALIRIHLDNKHRKIYVFEEMYKAGMQDIELLEELKKRIKNQYVVCDCAEAKTIAYLKLNGIKALPCKKGSDSINYGIRFLKGYEIIVDVQCQNFKNEIQEYHWAEDKYGNTLDRPVDKNNHLLDALRYAVEGEMLRSNVKATGRLGRL